MTVSLVIAKSGDPCNLDLLEEVAAWIDQNKFPCTMASCDGLVEFIVEPDPGSGWELDPDWSFANHAATVVIQALNAKLAEVSK